MPYINARTTFKLSEKEKETIKSRMGDLIRTIPGKSETWLMVSFDDDKTLYFRGVKMEKAAVIEVKIAGTTSRENKNRLTNLLCEFFENEMEIPKDNIYVIFSDIADWGWNGGLF